MPRISASFAGSAASSCTPFLHRPGRGPIVLHPDGIAEAARTIRLRACLPYSRPRPRRARRHARRCAQTKARSLTKSVAHMEEGRLRLAQELGQRGHVPQGHRVVGVGRLVVAVEEGIGVGRELRERVARQHDVLRVREDPLHEGQDQRVGRGLVQANRLVALGRQVRLQIVRSRRGRPPNSPPAARQLPPQTASATPPRARGRRGLVHLVPHPEVRQRGAGAAPAPWIIEWAESMCSSIVVPERGAPITNSICGGMRALWVHVPVPGPLEWHGTAVPLPSRDPLGAGKIASPVGHRRRRARNAGCQPYRANAPLGGDETGIVACADGGAQRTRGFRRGRPAPYDVRASTHRGNATP